MHGETVKNGSWSFGHNAQFISETVLE